ncbi:MAG: serine/threonine protein kinase [Gammaproteobacteria bacterium]|jgi:NAD(P)-dependent dehydrogenase (short-subunit alcohol dehydrogenase family)|nr:serine/threonine protein kinase [Gammaproteobacteria bacterium]
MGGLTFEDRVVVVTGGGNGIGRAYAHEFARRGARVVVNDLGGSVDGVGSDRNSADAVVEEITAANGQAVANYNSVEDGEGVVATATDTWGRVDIVLNNAGIAYRTPFAEMTRARWENMMNIHVGGSYACSRAAWPHMVAQGFGRLLFTSSPFGLYACAGFSHYSAAKAGLIGLTKALALEGAEHGIQANAVAPYSASRMTGFTNEEQATSEIGPRYLAQLAVWLSHADTAETGSIFEVGGGYVHKVHLELSRPVHLPGDEHTAEGIAAGSAQFDDLAGSLHPPLGDYNTIGRAVFGPDLARFRDVGE